MIENILLENIRDNPYQPRRSYQHKVIEELASSIAQVGLLEPPIARKVNGSVEMAFGHLRLRAFKNLNKNEPEKWLFMPCDIRELSDEEMFLFAIEENIKRNTLKPIDIARTIAAYIEHSPETTEKHIGIKLSMSEANISNMLRVLRLPERFLEKIDEGIITFTQGRELLTLEGLPNAEDLMSDALAGINTTGNKRYSEPNTVEGLQHSIHSAIKNKFPPLDKEWEGYYRKLLFDTREAGCLKCDKCIITHPNKSQAAHYCTDEVCWEKKTEEHKDKAAAAARAKMEAEVLERVKKEAAQRVPEPAKSREPPREKQVIFIGNDKDLRPHIEASYSGDSISEKGSFVKNPFEHNGKLYINTGDEVTTARKGFACYELVVPREEYTGVTRTYEVPRGREYQEYYESLRTDPNGFYHGMLVKWGKRECVLVGPEVTFVYQSDQADISQEKPSPAVPNYTLEKRGSSWIALDDQGRVIAESQDKERANADAVLSFKPVLTNLNPYPGSGEYVLNHTYRIIPKTRKADYEGDVTAQDLATAINALGLKPADVQEVKVYKSSGKVGTGGYVSAGWSKCTEPLEKADLRDKQMKEAREKANQERKSGEIPCETCDRDPICGREGFYSSEEGDRYVCDTWEPSESHAVLQTEVPTKMQTIPDEVLQQAKAAAGTRAEVLDLCDICTGERYMRQMKQGYVLLSDEIDQVDEPEDCLKRCTHGFHHAFDSKDLDHQRNIYVCSDPKCFALRKGALTRKKNAAGQALKNAERKAIQEAIAGAGNRPRGLMMLVIYAQLKGSHISSYYSGSSKSPEKWLWDKLSAGTKEGERNVNALMKRLDKLDEDEMRQLLVEMMFYYLADHGDTGSYQVKTELPLRWMGVDIQLEEKEKVSVGQG